MQYQRAIELAADKLLGDGVVGNELVVMVLGAGRGPLVSAAIKAEGTLRHRRNNDAICFRLFAVEKNENAIVTLKFMNDTYWRQRVRVVCSDMRSFRPDFQADIVISELLGSFGDNELSPECLDGARHIMKPTTINIPQSYTSYLGGFFVTLGGIDRIIYLPFILHQTNTDAETAHSSPTSTIYSRLT